MRNVLITFLFIITVFSCASTGTSKNDDKQNWKETLKEAYSQADEAKATWNGDHFDLSRLPDLPSKTSLAGDIEQYNFFCWRRACFLLMKKVL